MAEKFIPQEKETTDPADWIKLYDKTDEVGNISKEEQEQAKIDSQNPDFFTFTKEDEPSLESMQIQEYQKEIDKIIMQNYRIPLEKHGLHYENTFATNTKDGIPQKGAIYTEIQFSNKSNQKQIRKLKFDLKSQNGTAVLMNEKWESPLHTKLLGLTKEIAQTISRSIVRDFAQAHTKGKEFKMNIENGKLIIKTIPEVQEGKTSSENKEMKEMKIGDEFDYKYPYFEKINKDEGINNSQNNSSGKEQINTSTEDETTRLEKEFEVFKNKWRVERERLVKLYEKTLKEEQQMRGRA